MLAQVLKAAGYEVFNARTGSEALALARQHQGEVGLLLCDVVLPDRSSHEVALRIRELCPGMKTLFISGYPLEVLIESGRMRPETIYGENNFFLPKPFLPRELIRRVDGILALRASASAGIEQSGGLRGNAAH